MTKPPTRQSKACSTLKVAPQPSQTGGRFNSGFLYRKARAPRNSWLAKLKWWHSRGNTESQAELEFLALNIARCYLHNNINNFKNLQNTWLSIDCVHWQDLARKNSLRRWDTSTGSRHRPAFSWQLIGGSCARTRKINLNSRGRSTGLVTCSFSLRHGQWIVMPSYLPTKPINLLTKYSYPVCS